ncbi:MAG: MFS transporter [Candidatus Omnitrophica bacterium]|nr:MFS transporter [Candidatus Omnitrophota bacterium]
MNKKAALGTVFLVVLVDLMGFGIVLPLIPFYASKFNASPVAIGFLYSIYSFAQLVFSPLWGGFSDKIGRRPIMLLSTFGAVLAYILFGLAQSLGVLFLSRLVAGIMGGNISTAQAYVADVTTHDERAKGMGLIGAAFGIGFVVGPAISTILIHPAFHQFLQRLTGPALAAVLSENKYEIPGFFAAGLSFLSFLLVWFKLPETVQASPSGAAAGGDAERIEKVSLFSGRFWRRLSEEGNAVLSLLLLSIFLLALGQSSLYSGFPLFCKTRLLLSAEKVGMQFVYMGLLTALVQGGLIRILVKKYSEERLFLVGSILMVLGLGLIPFAPSEKILTLYLSVMAIGVSLNGPTLTSLISKKADPLKVGAMMGSSQGLAALGRVIGPAWGGFLYGISFKLPFILTAAVVSTSILIGIRLQDG